jgi:hypothetical protein
MNGKIRFSLRSSAGGFRAEGLDVPITANARNLGDLRAKLAAATKTFFGQERKFTMLVGVKEQSAAANAPAED